MATPIKPLEIPAQAPTPESLAPGDVWNGWPTPRNIVRCSKCGKSAVASHVGPGWGNLYLHKNISHFALEDNDVHCWAQDEKPIGENGNG